MILTLKQLMKWINRNKKDASEGRWYLYDNIGMVSGGFDPLHKGHVQYIRDAASRCKHLIVVVNGDSFLQRKKGFSFMPAEERAYIVDNLGAVDTTIIFNSESDTVDEIIEIIKPAKFFKGGDRTGPENIPEWDTCIRNNVEVITNVGGEKIQSSSELVEKAKKSDETFLKKWCNR